MCEGWQKIKTVRTLPHKIVTTWKCKRFVLSGKSEITLLTQASNSDLLRELKHVATDFALSRLFIPLGSTQMNPRFQWSRFRGGVLLSILSVSIPSPTSTLSLSAAWSRDRVAEIVSRRALRRGPAGEITTVRRVPRTSNYSKVTRDIRESREAFSGAISLVSTCRAILAEVLTRELLTNAGGKRRIYKIRCVGCVRARV